MKRTFVITTASILLIITLVIGALYWALQGQYASSIVNRISQHLSLPVTVYDAEFNLPNHVSLTGVDIEGLQETPISISKLDIWITPSSLFSSRPTIDSILIDGISLQQGIPQLPENMAVSLKQLAIKNLDYSDGDIIGRDINIQIKDPQFSDNSLPIPFGTIQFSAEQIYWRGEALDALLIDADYKPDSSTIYGLSFDWRGGKFSGQAEQYESGWSLVNFTIDGLRLTVNQWQKISQLGLGDIRDYVDHVNSLDVLKSSVETPLISMSNFDLSLENVKLKSDMWNQDSAYASMDADNITIHDQNLIEPAFQLELDDKKIVIKEFDTEFQQGLINTKGVLTPNSADLDFLNISGLKWIPESAGETDFITDTLSNVQFLNINTLEVKRSQFIQLNKGVRWQLSGLNAEGKQLSVIKDGKWGLWQGKLDISANSASYDNLLSSQMFLRMQNDEGMWSLQEAFIPLENGLIEATGTFDLSRVSQPWRFEVSADGIPLKFFSHWYSFPIDVEGITEFQLSTSGLGGDNLMFNHSLNAELIGTIREASLINESDEEESFTPHPIQFSDIQVNASRGQIELKPLKIEGESLKGLLEAKVDLLDIENSQMKLSLEQECQKKEWDLISGSESLNIHCSVD
ncbi:AsmA family protein [Vibrio hannami]|uniref:AsmA family protein n=1 Tax=Vibrio hannami TaxID=2717094 RepID=UPI00240F5C2B|nr:AsmA family protein [Vibrio hannami]MDG3086848.1 AsmA family protein [Vibrio hannami]